MRWYEIAPEDAAGIDCTKRPDLAPPRNQRGEVCPWPWDSQQLTGTTTGMNHRCPYCGEMVIGGVRHPDYGAGQQDDDESFMGPAL